MINCVDFNGKINSIYQNTLLIVVSGVVKLNEIQ